MTRTRKFTTSEPRHDNQPTAHLPVVKIRQRRVLMPVPTGQTRHISHVREGRISFEIFSKARIAKIPLDYEVEQEQKRGRGKAIVTDAAEKVREGREESQARDAEKVRNQKGRVDLLRKGEKGRRKRKSDKSGKQDVQKTVKKDEPQAAKKKVTKKKYVKREA